MEREMNVKQGFVYKENKLESRNKWRYELKTQNKVSCRRELFQKCWWYMPFSNFQSSAWVIFLYLFILVLNFTHLWSFHTAYELSFKILWAFTSQTRHLLQNVMFFFHHFTNTEPQCSCYYKNKQRFRAVLVVWACKSTCENFISKRKCNTYI